MNNSLKSLLLVCIALLMPTFTFGFDGINSLKDLRSFKGLKPEELPKLLDFLSQNGKFKKENFNGDSSFNNYFYWLGLCNLNDNDFTRAFVSFLYGASFAYTIKSDKVVQCKIAIVNTALLLRHSLEENKVVQDSQIEVYREAWDNKLEEGIRGLAVTYSLSRDYANANEILTKLMALPLTRDRAQILIFCSLVLNDPKYFVHVINEISDRDIIYDILLMNNLAVGYMKFRDSGITDAEKNAKELWNIIDDYLTAEKYEKTFRSPHVISISVHGKTNPLELSRNERRMVARLSIGSIGWANPSIDLSPEYDKLFESQKKEEEEPKKGQVDVR